MSMVAIYQKVTSEKLKGLIDNPETLSDFLFSEESYEEGFDIDKTWQAIHFLLNHHPWEGDLPLFNVVFGGKVISDEDFGYGPARYLTIEEVNAVNVALNNITPEELWSRFDVDAFRTNDIYPGFEGTKDDKECICSYYKRLQNYFQQAANEKLAMILYMS